MTRKPTQDEWSRITALFGTVIDLPDASREVELARMDEDPFVLDQVRSLLDEDGGTGILDHVLIPDAAYPGDYASLAPDTRVGVYRTERLIGRGGMGEVYLARRDEVDFVQKVALKLLRPEAAGRTNWFDSERQLLAGLEHPGIARLIDGGVAADGRAFMALEYVDGEPIDIWCAEHRADLPTRLRLFLDVCDAVEYAHARLVLHLDLKPSNILIDTDGRARLLDFGIARLIDPDPADPTRTRALLTPDYAAPEQLAGTLTTVASDVYALGAVLFELLTGRGPWKSADAPLPNMVRRLLHEDPPFPSSVTEPGAIPASRISGDLDAIILKAMRHDPASRYAGVSALAADVRRYLDLKPVQARAGSTSYRIGRFLRRNRLPVAASAVAVLVLLAGVSGVAWQARQTAIERDIARAEARKAQAVNAAMSLMFGNARTGGDGAGITARDLLDQSAEELTRSFGVASPDTAAIVAAVADLYIQMDKPAGAEAILTKALEQGVGKQSPEDLATLRLSLGTAKVSMTKFDEAKRLLDLAEAFWKTNPDRYAQQRLETISAQAHMFRLLDKRDEGISLLTQSLPDAEKVYADKPRELLVRYNNLAVHLLETNRVKEADAVLKRAEDRAGPLLRSPVGLSLIQLRGGVVARQGDHQAALTQFQRAAALRRELYGPSFGLAGDLLAVGRIMASLGQVRESIPILREGAELARIHAGPASQQGVMFGVTLAEAHAHLGQVAEARTALSSIEPALVGLDSNHLLRAIHRMALGQIFVAEKRFADAEAAYDAADAIFGKAGASGAAFRGVMPNLRQRLETARKN